MTGHEGSETSSSAGPEGAVADSFDVVLLGAEVAEAARDSEDVVPSVHAPPTRNEALGGAHLARAGRLLHAPT
jgi:hypothetical protein